MGKRKSRMKREELIGWLEEAIRQLKIGTLMVDGEKIAVPEEIEARIKTKNKKGRSSLKLHLEWDTEPAERAREDTGEAGDEGTRGDVCEDDGGAEQEPGAKRGTTAKVRDYDAHVLFCTGGDCKKKGAKETRGALKGELRARGMNPDVRVDEAGCLGLCKHGPNAVVYDGADPKGTWYLGLKKNDVPEVVEEHLIGGEPVRRIAAERRPRKARVKR